MKSEPKLYSLDDACLIMGGISRSTLYRLVNDNKIKIIKIYSRAFVDAKSIDNFIKTNFEPTNQ